MAADFPSPRIIDADGVALAIYEADGDPERRRPPVVLVHGWPEIAYSWRNQIAPLAEAGFRVIALDLKGFGNSDAPEDVALYDMAHVTGDFSALLDALDVERAIFCGHDWGGAAVWGMGQLRPGRTAGVVGVCTPVRPRAPAPPIEILKQRFGEKHYMVQFQEPGAPEALFQSDVGRFFRLIFRRPAPREVWPKLIPQAFDVPEHFRSGREPGKSERILGDEDLQVYIDAYRRSGFAGGINLYRNINRNWAHMEGRDETVRAPSLWIGADLDLFLPPEFASGMEMIVPDLEKHVLPGVGHWVMWEAPEKLNAILIEWLTRRFTI